MNIKIFDQIPANTVFATGITANAVGGLNMSGTGELLYWAAVKGNANDWSLYCSRNRDIDYIQAFGDKVHFEDHILNVMAADKEVMKRYRH